MNTLSKTIRLFLNNKYALIVLSCFAFLVNFYIDFKVLGHVSFDDKAPDFGCLYLLRTGLIITGSALFVLFILTLRPPDLSFIPHNNEPELWNTLEKVPWRIDRVVKNHTSIVKKFILCLVFSVSTFFLYLFLVRPIIFHKLCLEDGPIEYVSALFCFITMGLFGYVFFTLRYCMLPNRWLYLLITLGFVGISFLLGMEEVSWFQRVFSIETPNMFEKNIQGELNIHNFATNEFENIYYFFSFLGLILIPFLNENLSIFRKYAAIEFFVPSRYIVFASCLFASYNWDMWNMTFTQISFFITFFIVIYYLLIHAGKNNHTIFLAGLFTFFVLTQLLFLLNGKNIIRKWDVTEYKEFFIPLGFLIYSYEIFNKANKTRKLRNVARTQSEENENSLFDFSS